MPEPRPFVSVKFDAVGRTHRFLLPEIDFEPPLHAGEPVVVTRGDHRASGTVTRSVPQLAARTAPSAASTNRVLRRASTQDVATRLKQQHREREAHRVCVMKIKERGLAMKLKRFSNRPCTTWGGRGTSARTDAGGPMRAYSMDLRERALLDSDAGMKAADVAAKYRVSGSWVRLLNQRRRETGEVAPRVQRHGRRGMLEPHLHTLAALIAAHPDRTLAELKDALATPARVPTVWRAVRALGLTVKKNGPPVRTRSA